MKPVAVACPPNGAAPCRALSTETRGGVSACFFRCRGGASAALPTVHKFNALVIVETMTGSGERVGADAERVDDRAGCIVPEAVRTRRVSVRPGSG
jgi:hypothetical protein